MTSKGLWRLPALDHPALGLVMMLAAVLALTSALPGAVSFVFLDASEPQLLAFLALSLVGVGLQLAAGAAIVRRSEAAWPLFVAYVIFSAAGLIVSLVMLGDEMLGPRGMVAVALQTLGVPLVIIVAPLVLDLDQPTERSPAHAAGALLITSLSSLIGLALQVMESVQLLTAGVPITLAAGASQVIVIAARLVVAVLAIRAARTLIRPGEPRAARRALATYAIATIAIDLALQVITAISVTGLRGAGEPLQLYLMMIVQSLVAMLCTALTPIVIWRYAWPALRTPITATRRDAAAPVLWIALWTTPFLLASVLVFDLLRLEVAYPLAAASGAGALVLAVLYVGAARAAHRGQPNAVTWAVPAAVIGGALFAFATLYLSNQGGVAKLAQLTALLVITPAVLAWTRRAPRA